MLQKLDTPPDKSDTYLWADFVELRALTHPDKAVCRGEIAEDVFRNNDMLSSEPSQDNDASELESKESVRFEKRWRAIVDFHSNRAIAFEGFYPFRVSEDLSTIHATQELNPGKRAYVALLTASCLRNVLKERHDEVTREFEEICWKVFSGLMPNGSMVKAAWARAGAEAPYKGKLIEKLRRISEDIRAKANLEERDFKPNDTGDGGIDMVAWHPMGDNRDNIPISLAQCGCSRDEWMTKQLEASHAKLGNLLVTKHPWANYYFLPFDFRDTDGGWAHKRHINMAIFVDRLRMLRLGRQFEILDQMGKASFVESVCSTEFA